MKPIHLTNWCLLFVCFISGYSNNINKISGQSSTIKNVCFGAEYTNKNTSDYINNIELFSKIKSNRKTIKSKSISKLNSADDKYIRVGFDSPDGTHRQLLVGFLPDSPCDLNYNIGYDALMFDARTDELFFEMANDTINKYVIEGVGVYNNSMELPLGVSIGKVGVHKIMIDAVENFTDPIYIKDMITGGIYNLSAGSFIVNLPLGDYYKRFKIVFKTVDEIAQKTLDVANYQLSFLKCYLNGEGNLVLTNSNSIELNTLIIYNLNGMQLIKIDLNNNHAENNIPFDYENGLYFVKIVSEYGVKTLKLLR